VLEAGGRIFLCLPEYELIMKNQVKESIVITHFKDGGGRLH
jgi:hypothetical protein